jgi:hypothetical protein
MCTNALWWVDQKLPNALLALYAHKPYAYLACFVPAVQLLICGQAMSHCVNYTTRDIIEHWDRSMSGVVVLTDGTYAVLLVACVLCLYRTRYCVRVR